MSHTRLFLVVILFLSLLVAAPADERATTSGELRGRVVVPESATFDGLRVLLWAGASGEVENEGLDPIASADVDAQGQFVLSHDDWRAEMQLEFVGPATRRARFPVELNHVGKADKRGVFRLDAGGRATLLLSRDGSGEILSGAVVGPLFPAAESAPEMMESTYPFLVRGDADGVVVIDGLIAGVDYDAPLFVPGHERQTIRVRAGMDQRISLVAGGASVRGTVLGARTGNPYTGLIVQARHGQTGALVLRRMEADGTFLFEGLAPATYVLRPVKDELGDLPGAEFILNAGDKLDGAVLLMPEGIAVAGMVTDVETGLGLGGATVQLGDKTVVADPSGEFRFDTMMGPWPRTLAATLAGYEPHISAEGADDGAAQVETNGIEDVAGRVVRLRKQRFLELTVDAGDAATSAPDLTAMVELLGSASEGDAAVERVRAPLGRSEHPWRARLPRVVVARTAAGLAAPPVLIETYDQDTTATATLDLVPAAGLRGRVRYDDDTAPPLRLRLLLSLSGELVEMTTAAGDEAGAFELAGLPPGPLRVEAQRSDTRQSLFAEDIVLVSGQVASLDRIVARGKRFAGRVLNAEGAPMAGFQLDVYGRSVDGSSLATAVTTRDDGRFALEDLGGPALDEISWQHEQFKPSDLKAIALPQEDYLIVLEPRSGVKVIVESSGDLLDGEILVLAGTRRSDALYKGQWFYDSVGRLLLKGEPEVVVQPRTSGDLRIAVRVGRVWDVSPAFRWSGGDDEKTLTMAPASTGRLRVDVDGLAPEALAAADVLLLNTTLPTGMTRPPTPRFDGQSILFEGLDPGAHLLVVTTTTAQIRRLENIEISNTQEATRKLRFGTAGDDSIRGRVVLATTPEKPLAGVDVELAEFIAAEPDVVAKKTSGSDGAFAFERPETTGILMLIARWEGQTAAVPLSAEGETVVAFQQTVKVDFVVPPALRTRLVASPAMPLLFSPADGLEGLLLPRAAAVDERQSMRPGEYVVSLGDGVIGSITVREGASPQRVELPTGEN